MGRTECSDPKSSFVQSPKPATAIDGGSTDSLMMPNRNAAAPTSPKAEATDFDMFPFPARKKDKNLMSILPDYTSSVNTPKCRNFGIDAQISSVSCTFTSYLLAEVQP